MEEPLNQVITSTSFQELFAAWNRYPDAVLYAGGTDIVGKQDKIILDLPPVFLCLDKVEELHRITRTEHYLEIGSMIKLNKLITLGKVVPSLLRKCLEKIAGVQVRNLATIGGNICTTSRLLDLSGPLTALDAQYELRNASGTRWVSAARFHSEDHTSLENQEILSRIRLPLHQWDYAVYKKFYTESNFDTESLVFLAKTQKNLLPEIRIVYKGHTILRNREAEGILNGKNLPISRKTADDFIQNWKEFLDSKPLINEISKFLLINSIEENIYNLSE